MSSLPMMTIQRLSRNIWSLDELRKVTLSMEKGLSTFFLSLIISERDCENDKETLEFKAFEGSTEHQHF